MRSWFKRASRRAASASACDASEAFRIASSRTTSASAAVFPAWALRTEASPTESSASARRSEAAYSSGKSRAATKPCFTCCPSRTLISTKRPGVSAERAARVRATT